MKKIRFPFPTSRNDELRGGAGWDRIEKSLQEITSFINSGNDAITAAIEAAETAQDAAETAASQAMSATPEGYSDVLASIAEEFSAEKAYSSGAIVWRNSKLYTFTADHTAGAWTGTDAEEIAVSTDLTDLKFALSDISEEVDNAVTPTINEDGYYGTDGTFHADTTRANCNILVFAGEQYKITTSIASTLIPGILFRNGTTVLSYDLLGSGSLQIITDYLIRIPENCDNIIVQNQSNLRTTAIKKVNVNPKDTVSYIDSVTLSLGTNIMANKNGTQQTGWSGNHTDGWTHAAGNSGHLLFYSADVVEGAVYICSFDTSYTAGEFVTVGFGSQYKSYVYNGTNHIDIPLLGDSTGNLYFMPIEDVTFTISNLSVRKIGGAEITQTFNLYNTFTKSHTQNYGFWDVFIGKNVAENAVGSTRTVAIGYAALKTLQGGHRNVALGTFAMSQMVGGENNVAIGSDSMIAIQNANRCISIGNGATYNGSEIADNVVVGSYALQGTSGATSSKNNVAVGNRAGSNTYGDGNTFVGYQAGYRCGATNGNTIVGKNAYGAATGNYNSCLGQNTGFSDGVSNSTAIGYQVTADKSNQVKIGNANVTEVVFCGNKKIVFNDDGTITWETVS